MALSKTKAPVSRGVIGYMVNTVTGSVYAVCKGAIETNWLDQAKNYTINYFLHFAGGPVYGILFATGWKLMQTDEKHQKIRALEQENALLRREKITLLRKIQAHVQQRGGKTFQMEKDSVFIPSDLLIKDTLDVTEETKTDDPLLDEFVVLAYAADTRKPPPEPQQKPTPRRFAAP